MVPERRSHRRARCPIGTPRRFRRSVARSGKLAESLQPLRHLPSVERGRTTRALTSVPNVHGNGLLIPFSCHVLRNLHHDMILGVDVLSSTESPIDLSNNSITFYDRMVDANLNKQSEVLLKTVNAVEIPPKSESLIPVSVPRYPSTNHSFRS